MTREEAINHLKTVAKSAIDSGYDSAVVDAVDMAREALEQEPCEDAISRQAVDDAIYDYSRSCDVNYQQIMEFIEKIPSVTPQPKTGHWIEKDGFDGDVYYDCSECGESWTTIEGTPWDNVWNYCPSCGARMVEPQESEDKE